MAYTDFIQQNIALPETRRIAIYNAQGNRVGQIPLGSLTPPNPAKKLYSFGALSDVHVVYDTAAEDFKRALSYLNDAEDVAFTCICGDLTDNGTTTQLAQYKAIVDSHSPDTPVYAVAGNHEQWASTSSGHLQDYTGKPLYYTFEHRGDLFVMLGVVSGNEGSLFASGELDWLETTLNENAERKRVFVFQHVLAAETSGDVLGIYPYTKLRTNAESVRFKTILRAHPNAIWFHGHSHMKFYLQKYGDIANYDHVLGCHSIHIPSLAVPRDISASGGYTTVHADSEGYVVDVYPDGIHLRGRDFVKGEFLPIASYWLDTTLQTVDAGTYTDPTGTITT